MKEIKFKAWHKAEKKMCDVSIINFDQGAFLIGVKPGEDEIGDKYFIPAPTNGRFCNFDEFELLQYTGMNDKNGKEIYKGSVLKAYGKKITRFVVAFTNGSFDLYHEFARWGLLSRLFEMNDMPVEIIGSIYENPELLTLPTK